MKPIDLKICGLSQEGPVAAALDAGASHLGFVFFAPSPRNVAPGDAAHLAKPARGRAAIVAVTVDADDPTLDGIVAGLRPDILQLHGKESPQRVAAVRQRFGLAVMKAFSVRDSADLQAIRPYLGVADRVLFDARPPRGAELPGGNGISFDWSLLAGLDRNIDYMLSGGIGPDNVEQAILGTSASGIDVSSSVETAPGRKDEALIRRFLAAARHADAMRNRHVDA